MRPVRLSSVALSGTIIGALCGCHSAGGASAKPVTAVAPHIMPATSDTVHLHTATGDIVGTMQLPAHEGRLPVVLIIAGSGPTDRNGNSPLLPGANNSLKMLAEGLAARGIGSVRYDKRGIAMSRAAGSSEADLRFDNYVADAVAWIGQLRADPRFASVTVLGHSEGSLIGMIAANVAQADGYVSIAGVGRPAARVLHDQLATQLHPEMLAQTDRVLESLTAGRTDSTAPPALAALFRPTVQPYLISWFRYDPAAEIAKLRVPVLIVQGTTDIQVGRSDAELLAKAKPDARLFVIDGMNHVLKRVSDDRVEQIKSYSDPALPVVTDLLDGVTLFVGDLKPGRGDVARPTAKP